jgi:hypothetical protein
MVTRPTRQVTPRRPRPERAGDLTDDGARRQRQPEGARLECLKPAVGRAAASGKITSGSWRRSRRAADGGAVGLPLDRRVAQRERAEPGPEERPSAM